MGSPINNKNKRLRFIIYLKKRNKFLENSKNNRNIHDLIQIDDSMKINIKSS